MATTATTGTATGRKPSRWDPYQVRRCVRFQMETVDGVAIFASKSFTAAEPEDKYHPCVDLVTGAVTCDCPHFTFRLAKNHPTATEGEVCKHLARALANIKRHGIDL